MKKTGRKLISSNVLKVVITFFSFFYFLTFYAQTRNPAQDINRANVWRFGSYSVIGANDVPGLDFSSGSPVVINEGQNAIRDGATSISDLSGNLQLYGGKLKMFSRLNGAMVNSGVVGDSGWVNILQANLAIPMPGSPDIIYYFSASVTLKYSVVDMSLNSGNGAVIKRNVDLHPFPVGAKLGAVHHCNGSDVWIMGHEWNNDKFYAYLLTDTGVNINTVINQIGPVNNEQGTWQGGCIKFSPDGNRMAASFDGLSIEPYIFDFDKNTAILSNPIPLQRDSGEAGLSFSPGNNILYVSTKDGKIVQYNLGAGNAMQIKLSRKLIAKVFTGFTTMQIGRDGKIYVSKGGFPGSDYVAVINNPNALDTLCNFNPNGIYLNGAFGHVHSLMNAVESYFYTGSSAFPCYGDTAATVISIPDFTMRVKLYPNPITEYAFIEIESTSEVLINLFDVLGNECNANIKAMNSIGDIHRAVIFRNQLPPGIYFVAIKTMGKTQSIKLSIL